MFDKDIIKLAWTSLWRRKLRTILTMVGIMIGTAGIVIMISLGAGLEKSITGEFEESNMTNIEVYPSYDMTGTSSEIKVLKKDDVTDLEKLDGVKAVTPFYMSSGELSVGRDRIGVQLVGIDMHQAENIGYELEDGRFPRNNEILIGSTLLEEIQKTTGDENIIRKPAKIITMNVMGESQEEAIVDGTAQDVETEESLKLQEEQSTMKTVENENRSKIVGILKSIGGTEDYSAIMDLEALIKMTGSSQIIETQGYSSIRVIAENTEIVKELSTEINDMGYMSYSTQDVLESISSISKYLQIFLGGIGSIALLVAAIGITNTMIMSIYERTKEIGVNKVIGASVKDVRTQFLYEASFIGLMGGVAGLMMSYLVTTLINFIAEMVINTQTGTTEAIDIAYISPSLALFAIVFSIVIGILAGLYPANRAAKISVLEALRQE